MRYLPIFIALLVTANAVAATTDTAVHLRPTAPPTFGADHKAVDPVFGSTILRVTGPVGSNAYTESVAAENVAPVQHFTGPWNMDGTRFVVWYDRLSNVNVRSLVRQYSFDPETFTITGYKDMKTYSGGTAGSDVAYLNYNRYLTYSHTSADLVYGIAGVNNETLGQYDFSTDTGSVIPNQPNWLTIFKADYLDAVSVSDDANIWGFSVYNTNTVGNQNIAYVVWNRSAAKYTSVNMLPEKVVMVTDPATDLVSYPYANLNENDAVTITVGTNSSYNILPEPLTTTTYYVKNITYTGATLGHSTFNLSATPGGAVIDLTTAGSTGAAAQVYISANGPWLYTGSGTPKPSALFMSRDGQFVRTQGTQAADANHADTYIYIYQVTGWDGTPTATGTSYSGYSPVPFAGKMSYYSTYTVNEDSQQTGGFGYSLWYRNLTSPLTTYQRVLGTPSNKWSCHPAVSQGGGYTACGMYSATTLDTSYGSNAWTLDSGSIYSKLLTNTPAAIEWLVYAGVAFTQVASKAAITGPGMYWYDSANYRLYTWVASGGAPTAYRMMGGVWPAFADELVVTDVRNNQPTSATSPQYPYKRVAHLWGNYDGGSGGNAYDETPAGLSWDNRYALFYSKYNQASRHDVFIVSTSISQAPNSGQTTNASRMGGRFILQ